MHVTAVPLGDGKRCERRNASNRVGSTALENLPPAMCCCALWSRCVLVLQPYPPVATRTLDVVCRRFTAGSALGSGGQIPSQE